MPQLPRTSAHSGRLGSRTLANSRSPSAPFCRTPSVLDLLGIRASSWALLGPRKSATAELLTPLALNSPELAQHCLCKAATFACRYSSRFALVRESMCSSRVWFRDRSQISSTVDYILAVWYALLHLHNLNRPCQIACSAYSLPPSQLRLDLRDLGSRTSRETQM